jgi:hypothetical protein
VSGADGIHIHIRLLHAHSLSISWIDEYSKLLYEIIALFVPANACELEVAEYSTQTAYIRRTFTPRHFVISKVYEYLRSNGTNLKIEVDFTAGCWTIYIYIYGLWYCVSSWRIVGMIEVLLSSPQQVLKQVMRH